MMNGQFCGMGWGMWFIPFLTIVLVVLLYKNNNPTTRNETPMEILKKRYAKGEITKEEFEEIKNKIS